MPDPLEPVPNGGRRRRGFRAVTLLGAILLVGAAFPATAAAAAANERFDGFNVIATPAHPFGDAGAGLALSQAKRVGAKAIAIVPFLWQPAPESSGIGRGADMPDSMLRAAIRQARALGLAVIVKPHVWVPQSWAGAVAPASETGSEPAWQAWFTAYRRAVVDIARIAAEEHADAMAIGTELEKTTNRPEWLGVIAAVRKVFGGRLTYFAHNVEEAETVPFWRELDAVGVTLYPALGADRDRDGRLAVMRTTAERLDALAARTGRGVLVGEIGLRSAEGAAAKPWESAEERASPPDPLLQAQVLADWLTVLDRPTVHGVLVWRWFTDPAAGGEADTDFTVQGKAAEGVLLCMWTVHCRH
jgi:hypothetical protein